MGCFSGNWEPVLAGPQFSLTRVSASLMGLLPALADADLVTYGAALSTAFRNDGDAF